MYSKLKSYFPKNPISLIRKTIDGFKNVLTGLNTEEDKKTATTILPDRKLTYQELVWFFRSNRYARKVCVKPASEITKHPIIFDKENKDSDLFSTKLKDMEFNGKSKESLIFEAFSGGAAMILDIQDGGLLHEPVNEKRIKNIGNDIIVLDADKIRPVDGLFNPRTQTEFYYVNLTNGETFIIHISRLLLFTGAEVALIEEKIENNGFSDSILQSLYEAIRNVSESVSTCATILLDFNQTVFRIKGLNGDLKDEKGEETIIRRLRLMMRSKSAVRGIVMDSEDEFDRAVANLANVKEFISIFKDDLTAQSDFPSQIMHGDAYNASLGDAGQPELINFYSNIEEQRNDRWKPQCEKLIRYIGLWLKKEVPTWEYANLWDLDDIEKALLEKTEAETEKLQSETDGNNITNGIFTAEEIKQSKIESGFRKNKSFFKLKSKGLLKAIGAFASNKSKKPAEKAKA